MAKFKNNYSLTYDVEFMINASQKVEALNVSKLNDLARFVEGMISMGQPAYVIHFTIREKHIYGLLAVYHNY